MPMADLERLLECSKMLVSEASANLLVQFRGLYHTQDKLNGSPVTSADYASEEIIVAGLMRLTPGINVVAEESVYKSGGPSRITETFWLVDPLDGTREFISGSSEFTVNIALIECGLPILGVVLAPALGVLWAGGRGLGAWREDGTDARPIRARKVPDEGLTVLGSRSHSNDAALWAYLSGRKVARFRAAGSSLKFCLLAEGQADLYPRFGRTMEWDTAAGHAVLLAAGGNVCTMDGQALGYGKAEFVNPHFVAIGKARDH